MCPSQKRRLSLCGLLLGMAAAGGCGSLFGPPDEKPGALAEEASFRLDSGHFMQGVVLGDDYLVGLSFNGIATFDRATWKPRMFPTARCGRMAAHGERVYCTHHDREVQVISYPAGERRVTGITSVMAMAPASLEGLAVWQGALYVAARQGGILRVALDGSSATAVALPPGLGEPWDIAPLSDRVAVVALGPRGLALLDFRDPDRPSLLASLPLPGVAIAVTVSGTRAYVATLSGGAHAIDLADPSAPRVIGAVVPGALVYDVREVGSLVVISAGYHQISARWIDGRLSVVGVRASTSWALASTDGTDGRLYSAEFGIAGRYAIDSSRPPGAYLRPIPGARAPARGSLTVTLPFENLGSTALEVERVHISPRNGGADHATLPGFTLAPGATTFLEASVDAEEYQVQVDSSANLGSSTRYDLRRGEGLQPGDRLPSPLAYQDKARRLHDVIGGIAGKVGVVMVGAATCPVAFYALHASRHDLGERLAAGTVAAFSIDPWDNTDHGEMAGLDEVFPHLLTPLTTADSHDHSAALDALGQPTFVGPPMPIVYVVGRDGTIRYAAWGYEPAALLHAVAAAVDER